jgi:hypothetical protein
MYFIYLTMMTVNDVFTNDIMAMTYGAPPDGGLLSWPFVLQLPN